MNSQKIRIKRVRETAVIPEYKTKGAAAFDFTLVENVTIEAKEIARLPTGLVIKTPPGHVLLITCRSSAPEKKGIQLANNIAVIDSDYCGDEDEILLLVQNIREEAITLEAGDRIAQGMIVPIVRAEFEEVKQMNAESRGGFGSTGV